jgi:hypothetical protein
MKLLCDEKCAWRRQSAVSKEHLFESSANSFQPRLFSPRKLKQSISFIHSVRNCTVDVLSFNKQLKRRPDRRVTLSPKTLFRPLYVLLLMTGFNLNADVIDSYLPFLIPPVVVGPGETIPEEQAVVYSDDILGGVRFAAPGIDAQASASSIATMGTGGGAFTCTLRFPNDGNENNGGGCATRYGDEDAPVFDLSGSTMFLFEARDVSNNPILVVTVGDTNGKTSIGNVQIGGEGQFMVRFDQMFPTAQLGGANLSMIDSIVVAMTGQPGSNMDITLLEFSTDGPIGTGPGSPGGDQIVAEELSGSYYNAARSGEGCQLTLERGGFLFILTCYLYNNGEQFWLIGLGFLQDGQIIFDEMTITSGADYGASFNPADVVRQDWGAAIMTWANCNNAELELMPVLQGYGDYTMVLTRIIPVTCAGGGAQGSALPWMGSWFWPSRDGEGFQLSVEGDNADVFVMTWYTYLDGKQVWMIGTGVRSGNKLVFSEMVITSGTGYGPEFNADDVIRETFGSITFDFTDCNNLTATVDSQLPEFSDIVLDEIKIVPLDCPP